MALAGDERGTLLILDMSIYKSRLKTTRSTTYIHRYLHTAIPIQYAMNESVRTVLHIIYLLQDALYFFDRFVHPIKMIVHKLQLGTKTISLRNHMISNNIVGHNSILHYYLQLTRITPSE
jgi:hypothetical protein